MAFFLFTIMTDKSFNTQSGPQQSKCSGPLTNACAAGTAELQLTACFKCHWRCTEAYSEVAVKQFGTQSLNWNGFNHLRKFAMGVPPSSKPVLSFKVSGWMSKLKTHRIREKGCTSPRLVSSVCELSKPIFQRGRTLMRVTSGRLRRVVILLMAASTGGVCSCWYQIGEAVKWALGL